MLIFRSPLSAKEISAFYLKSVKALGWKENKDETLLLEEAEVGALTFEKGDASFRILIQPGKPDSRTRMVIEGQGLVWDKPDEDGDSAK